MASTKNMTPAERKASKRIMRSPAYKQLQGRYKGAMELLAKTRSERDGARDSLEAVRSDAADLKQELEALQAKHKELQGEHEEIKKTVESFAEKLGKASSAGDTVVDPNPRRILDDANAN